MESYLTQPFQIVSQHPRIVVYPNFIDKARSDHIISMASGRLRGSKLALRKGDKLKDTGNIRTSQGTFLTTRSDPKGALAWLDNKIAAITHVPVSHFEAFNVLRYELGQHYDAHHDVFHPEEYGAQASNRIATVLVYLAAPDEGGETIFPLEGVGGEKNQQGYNYKTCDRGYMYKPRAGDAVLFWSVKPDGTFDRQSLHGGCPVVAGTKWVATKWIRDKPQ